MATWSEAFARQAASDLDAYYLPTKNTLPASHQLHYLQMWLEKLCKAYLWRPETPEGEVAMRTTHQVVAKVLPRLISERWRRIDFEKRPDIKLIRDLCREIDLLHPQVHDDGKRPENVEYPWPGSSGTIEIPAQWKFRLAQRLRSSPGRLLLKAAGSLTRNPAILIYQL
jgi:hypothetical protein